MAMLRVTGGMPLSGTIRVQGAKNAVLPILAASVLNGGESIIHNCPELTDVGYTLNILSELGCEVTHDGSTVRVNSADMCGDTISEELMRKMRSSIIFMGAILARMGTAAVSIPGGCNIGSRPIDLHLSALSQLGADIREEYGFIHCRAARLHGTSIYLDFPSVGATENIMFAACTAEGVTVISNAAREPEIIDLARFLNRMGARISGAGESALRIDGTERLGNVEYTIMPDRIAGATYLVMAAATCGELELQNTAPQDMNAMISVLGDMGAKLECECGRVRLKSSGRLTNIKSIRTMPYPGFPTDIQPPFMALAAVSRETAVFTETIFENRFRHAAELSRMGADIRIHGKSAVVRGVRRLFGTRTTAYDLRGGAAELTAALSAEGETIITDAEYIDRGYERIEDYLSALGARVTRISE